MLEPQAQLLAVVKADAYGHGAVQTARVALEAGASWLGVATVTEGLELRDAGVSAPILLLCAPAPGEVEEMIEGRLTPMVGDRHSLHLIAQAADSVGIARAEVPLHLELDLGIGRAGVLPDQAEVFLCEAKALGIPVVGLTSHFPDADGDELELTLHQQALFHQVRRRLEAGGVRFAWTHTSNSAATLRLDHEGENLVRPGRLLYGILPPNSERHYTGRHSNPPLHPALTLKAHIAVIRELPEGHSISYGCTYRLTRPSRVATVLIGYGDGYPRSLSNIGTMLLHGKHAPIIGRICMDQSILDVTDIPEAQAGDTVTCIGQDGEERILAVEIAQRIGTTEHAITTRLTGRIPRVFPDEPISF
jgi:alanine racemase